MPKKTTYAKNRAGSHLFCKNVTSWVRNSVFFAHFVNRAINPRGKIFRMQETDFKKNILGDTAVLSWICCAAQFPHCNSEAKPHLPNKHTKPNIELIAAFSIWRHYIVIDILSSEKLIDYSRRLTFPLKTVPKTLMSWISIGFTTKGFLKDNIWPEGGWVSLLVKVTICHDYLFGGTLPYLSRRTRLASFPTLRLPILSAKPNTSAATDVTPAWQLNHIWVSLCRAGKMAV